MAALGRTVALPKVQHVAVIVSQDLHFDVPRAFDVLLDVNTRILERFFGFRGSSFHAPFEGDVVHGDTHSLAAAACCGFDQHGIADFCGDLGGFVDIGELVAMPQAGAEYRFGLLWVVLMGTVGAIAYAEMTGRVELASQRTVFDLIRERLGLRLGLVPLTCL